MTKASLPPDFIWGFATASYQIEGGASQDGRGLSIWDTFCQIPGKIADGTSGDIACDSYNRIGEDIALLKQTGAKMYRFSVSWSRVIPLGGRNDPINHKGLRYYTKLVDDLLAAGIDPMVTLFHWDLPEELHRRYGGPLNKKEFVADFTYYAQVMFTAMGARVKHWITFNEPWCSSILGYSTGIFAPGRTSDRSKSADGDSSTEPWIVGHNILVAHGTAVKLYREHFKPSHGGQIGITLNGDWAEPWDPCDPQDVAACERKLEFTIGWFAYPIYHGYYPVSLVSQLGSRLPAWSAEDRALVHGSNDFYGMNHYTANYIRHKPGSAGPEDYEGHLEILYEDKEGRSIGPETQSVWLKPNAEGFRKTLRWIHERCGGPRIFVTENGTSVKGESEMSREEILEDNFRLQYYKDYIGALVKAVVEDGVDVRGYMAWSLLDNFEWADGQTTRFGVTYVDYNGDQKRYLKKSGREIGKIFDAVIKKT